MPWALAELGNMGGVDSREAGSQAVYFTERRRTTQKIVAGQVALLLLLALLVPSSLLRLSLTLLAVVVGLLALRPEGVDVLEDHVVVRSPWATTERIPIAEVQAAIVVPRRSYATEVRHVPPRVSDVVVTRTDKSQRTIHTGRPNKLARAILNARGEALS